MNYNKIFNTKEKIENLRQYLYECAFNSIYDDARHFINDCLWDGCKIKGYKSATKKELISELSDFFDEEDIKTMLPQILDGSILS